MRSYVTPYAIRNPKVFEDFLNWVVDQGYDVETKTSNFELRVKRNSGNCIMYKKNFCNRDFLALCRNYLSSNNIKFKVH